MLEEDSFVTDEKNVQGDQIGGRKPERAGTGWRWDRLRAFLWYVRGRPIMRVRWCPLLGLRQAPKLYLHELRGRLAEAAMVGSNDTMSAAVTGTCRDRCGEQCDMTVAEIKRETRRWNAVRDELLRSRRRLRAEERHGRRT